MQRPAWLDNAIPTPDTTIRSQAMQRQTQLTKPQGALGRLEELAIALAAQQGTPQPRVERVHITLFAADHGVCAEGVSAYPQSVTVEMLRNFARGGAAISVLARQLNAELQLIDVGTVSGCELPSVQNARLMAGTANMVHTAAMTPEQCAQALQIGRDTVTALAKVDLFIGGEMGIGNTTTATALACALLNLPAKQLTGAGTGLNPEGVAHKAAVIERALQHHQLSSDAPLTALHSVGGLELAALTGAIITCAQRGLPVLVDGFIVSVAALIAVRLCPAVRDWLWFAHQSAEIGHRAILQALKAQPLLDLGLRLGEASGAALAVPLLQHACALHNDMATFAEAAVSKEKCKFFL